MRLDFFLVIGLIVNTIFVVLYPTQILGSDPLGLSGQTDPLLQQYYSVNGSGAISSYNSITGEVEYNNQLYSDVEGAITSTEGDAGIFASTFFAIVDWIKTAMNVIKTIAMFVLGFIVLLFNLSYPFNILIGVPFALLYIFSIVSFIIGR